MRPNILWVFIEDASPHIGCYGETAINTPNIDQLAADGIRFENAFITAPVCSAARSALATGMYQTTLGAHNHRSQRGDKSKGGGNTAYYDSYELPASVKNIGNIFKENGYSSIHGKDLNSAKPGKSDYNFIEKEKWFDLSDWTKRPSDKPFFAQVHLHGGKNRKGTLMHRNFKLPPYYAETDVMKDDWATYLASWEAVDKQLGEMLAQLKKAGVYENTIIYFLTDHGVSHLRGKQFLYDEGIKIPLIVRIPGREKKGTVRSDLVKHIDIVAASLAHAGIAIPENVQGVDIFADDYSRQRSIISARDRCDETIDIIRSVRNTRFKYIRNFMSYRSHMQPNKYKDKKRISKEMRRLYEAGKLNGLQARIYNTVRPVEELYDLRTDPYETINLARSARHLPVLKKMRDQLYDWMISSRDVGLIPEPILEDMGKAKGSKYNVLKDGKYSGVMKQIIKTIGLGESGDAGALRRRLSSGDDVLRYWAATWLGNIGDKDSVEPLKALLKDTIPAVRIATALALCKLGESDIGLKQLCHDVDDANLIAGFYAIAAIEESGIQNDLVKATASKATKSKYDFTKRYADRIFAEFK